MFTLTKISNVVKVDNGSRVFYAPADSHVWAQDGRIFIGELPGTAKNYSLLTSMAPTEVNGRSSDDLFEVAEWVMNTYFSGLAGGGGGGGGGDASAANQVTQTAKLQLIIDEELDANAKTGSSLITEYHDNKQIVYTGDDINYVSYKIGGAEVARLTFGYSLGKLVTITKS